MATPKDKAEAKEPTKQEAPKDEQPQEGQSAEEQAAPPEITLLVRTVLTPQSPKGPYPGTVGAGSLDIAWTAADVANKQSFVASGNDLLLAWNSDVSAHTITLTSVPDRQGRTGDITAYSIAAGTIAAFQFDELSGWAQSDGTIQCEANHATVKFAVLKVA